MRLLILATFTLFIFSCQDDELKTGQTENENIQRQLDVEPSKFTIQPDRDTILFGQSGTVIFVEANSLEFENGAIPASNIEIGLKEYYSLSDMITQNLSTIADEGLLETGGMINLKINSNGQELKLKKGKDIIIHFPKNGNSQEMQLFSQSTSEQSDSIVRWREEKHSTGHEIDTITPFYTKYEDLNSGRLELEDGTNIWTWLRQEVSLTEEERDYVRLRDVNIRFIVSKNGEVKDVELEKKHDKKKCKRLVNLVSEMPKLKPYKRNGKEIDMESWLNFAVKYIPAKYLSNEAYLRAIENKYPEFDNQSINDISQIELNYYIFSTSKLGWLNCDHFINSPENKVNMTLKQKSDENLMIKFIYKDYKSIITPTYKNGINSFNDIPEGKDVTLMIIKSKRNKIQLSITDHKTKAGEITGIKFKDYTMAELKKELQKLN
ncbi:hypothetical protein KFE98_10665 [bacterium SCSIO 12741]|nr:hypothetical protein KFE98_10665 [bacterium SCSIO 12741]